MLFVPFLVFFFLAFIQIPVSEQSPRAAKKAAKLSYAKANNETIDLHEHGIKKGGEYGVDLLKDMFILLLDMIDTNKDGHLTRSGMDLFVDKMDKKVDTSETNAQDAVAKSGVKLLKKLLDNLWPYVQPEPRSRSCALSEALDEVKDGLSYVFGHGDTDEDDKLTHLEVEQLINLLKDADCSKYGAGPGKMWCKEKVNSKCIVGDREIDPVTRKFTNPRPWLCPGSVEKLIARRNSLVVYLAKVKCGLDAFFVQ